MRDQRSNAVPDRHGGGRQSWKTVSTMADEGLLSQDDINAALAEAGLSVEQPAEPAEKPQPASGSSSSPVDQAAIDAALAEAVAANGADASSGQPDTRVDSSGRPFDEVAVAMAAAIESENATNAPIADVTAADAPKPPPEAPQAKPLEIPDLAPRTVTGSPELQGIDLLRDVDLDVKVELGRSRMLVDQVLRLGSGSVVELNKLAGDPVDVFVNDRLVARGEVLVLNDNFCVRINDIVNRDGEEN